MRRAVALLAVVSVVAIIGCDGDDAEPGAPREATLVLDFQPNAVHAGIYSGRRRGYYDDEGVKLTVREPSASTDAPKLLQAGRAELAILDIHDLALARERGLDVVGVLPIVQRPLGSVIAARQIERPRDLEGREVGVTGLPSDDAVLEAVVEADGGDPDQVRRVTIGFESVAALSAGRVAAVTAFWNAEGVALRRLGVATREFRVDGYGAPRYPELMLVTSGELLETEADLMRSVRDATAHGYEDAVADPDRSLEDLLAGARGLDPEEQEAQLAALTDAGAFEPVGELDAQVLGDWARWDAAHGIVNRPPDVDAAFALDLSG
jgi:putative hydroxymethylpyrimidine transport system substrate-binding protein